jgi:hypothetical protein
MKARQVLLGICLPATLNWITLSVAAWLDPQLAGAEWWLLLSGSNILGPGSCVWASPCESAWESATAFWAPTASLISYGRDTVRAMAAMSDFR